MFSCGKVQKPPLANILFQKEKNVKQHNDDDDDDYGDDYDDDADGHSDDDDDGDDNDDPQTMTLAM